MWATVLASGAGYVVLSAFYGAGFLSEAAFFIDWMIVTLAVGGVRFGFRGLRQYLAAQRSAGRRVLLYGAGGAGQLTLRLLRLHVQLGLTPVGFIDDDLEKRGLTAQGIAVLGTFDDLPRVCEEHAVEEVLITTTRMSDARRQAVLARCQAVGVSCRTFELSLHPILTHPEEEPTRPPVLVEV